MKKNDIVSIRITDVTAEGNGVGKHEGMAVFVPETAVGDEIKAKIVKVLKSYAYGIVEEIITPSQDRVTPDCRHFPKCGGCSFRHISYEAELRLKEKFVRDAFVRIGKINGEFMTILGCEENLRYRNKAQYPVGQDRDGNAICGFYAKRSHRIISGEDCKLLPEIFGSIARYILDYADKNNIPAYSEESGRGVLRHIFIRQGRHSGEIMVCLVTAENCKKQLTELAENLPVKFPDVKSVVMNINSANTNVILGKQTVTLFGKDTITDVMCGNRTDISPRAFYQVNTIQAERLYKQAEEFADLRGEENLIDLYCGAGTIGLSMAGKVKKLIGVEIVPEAIENARKNAKSNGIENAEFLCGDAGDAAQMLLQRGEKPDVVVLDPPRKGSDQKTLDAVVDMNPERVVMISCNPSTAARDCAYLREKDYVTEKIRAVDLFPGTGHVECVVLLTRQ